MTGMLHIDLKIPFDIPRKSCGLHARKKSHWNENKQEIDFFFSESIQGIRVSLRICHGNCKGRMLE